MGRPFLFRRRRRNRFGEKKGEGIEYHVMLLSLLLIVIVRGSGAMSIDLWLISFRA